MSEGFSGERDVPHDELVIEPRESVDLAEDLLFVILGSELDLLDRIW